MERAVIDRNLAKTLVRRFADKRGFPRSDTPEGKAALSTLFDSMQRFCVDDRHARTVAEDLAVDTTFSPTSAEIYKVAMATRPAPKENTCTICGGTGFIQKAFPRTRIPGVEHATVCAAVVSCECQRKEL